MVTTNYAVEVVRGDLGRWCVQQQVTHRVFGVYRLKATAVIAARAVARALHVELLIKGRNGRIQSKDSHGHDPRDVPG